MLPPAAAAWRILRFSAIIHLQPFGTLPDTTLSASVVQSRSTNSVNREAAAMEQIAMAVTQVDTGNSFRALHQGPRYCLIATASWGAMLPVMTGPLATANVQ